MSDMARRLDELTVYHEGQDWRLHAACRGIDPDLFHPLINDQRPRRNEAAYEIARRYCDRCPVAAACLDYALTTNQTEGMWGGTTPRARRGRYRNHTPPHAATAT